MVQASDQPATLISSPATTGKTQRWPLFRSPVVAVEVGAMEPAALGVPAVGPVAVTRGLLAVVERRVKGTQVARLGQISVVVAAAAERSRRVAQPTRLPQVWLA